MGCHYFGREVIRQNIIFIALSAAKVVHLLYVWGVVPESLQPAHQQPFDGTDLSPWRVFRVLQRSPLFTRLAIVVLLAYTTNYGALDIAGSYVRGKFGIDKHDYASLNMVYGVAGILVQFALLPLLLRCLPTRRVLLCALLGQYVL
jgi:hypothetical protein